MVRFSDMLGGNGDAEEARAPVSATRPDAEPLPLEPVAAADTEPEPEGESSESDDTAPAESPERVLDRLTQYASSARASDVPEPAEPAHPAEPGAVDEPLTAVGDDLLPRAKGEKSKRRRK